MISCTSGASSGAGLKVTFLGSFDPPPASGSTSITSSSETCIFMKPASTSMRSPASMRRTRAGSRMPFSRTRAPSSTRGRCSSPWRASSCVESTVVSNSSRSSRFTFDTWRCALSFCAMPGQRLLRLLFELRQHLLGAPLQFLQLGRLALLPLARDLFLARRQFLLLALQPRRQRFAPLPGGGAARPRIAPPPAPGRSAIRARAS